MKKNNRDCKYIKFYVNDVEQKPRRNKKTGHIWHKTKQLPICQQGDELVICRHICEHFEPVNSKEEK